MAEYLYRLSEVLPQRWNIIRLDVIVALGWHFLEANITSKLGLDSFQNECITAQ